jgi:cystathionine gamma-synthase
MPLHLPTDLGRPIPDSPHAVSACLPTWADNIGYEEGEPRVKDKLTTGYPRFVYNRFCRDLFDTVAQAIDEPGQDCLVFPTRAAADRTATFINANQDALAAQVVPIPGALADIGHDNVHAVIFPSALARVGQDAWQHMGEGISSRQAEDLLAGRIAEPPEEIKQVVTQRVASLAGVPVQHTWLASCGMSGFAAVHRAVDSLTPGLDSVQFGFPYVDSLKVQQLCGSAGCWFLPRGDRAELDQLREALEGGRRFSGVYTEFPSNPLLAVPDLGELSELCRAHGVPLVVDETIAGFGNVDVLPVADVVCSSLTKSFSGVGDVTGGSIVVNPQSRFAEPLSSALDASPPASLYTADLIVLERNSRDYSLRLPVTCENASRLVDFLRTQPGVATVYFPDDKNPAGDCNHAARFDAFARPGGHRGPLFSILLENPEATTATFYNALAIDKGPNLGTNYTLACPFTILAHYHELEWAESCGVSRHLIRVSAGLEPYDQLQAAFANALDAVTAIR